MNKILTYLLLSATAALSSCSQLLYNSASFSADGMYATHDRKEIEKREQEELEYQKLQQEYRQKQLEALAQYGNSQTEYVEIEVPYDVYRYDWWGYSPFYTPFPTYRSYRYGYGYPYYPSWSYGYDPYWDFGWDYGCYRSPYWYSSCNYYHWWHYGHSHAPRPGIVGGHSTYKRNIVRRASSTTAPSTRSTTVRNRDGSTVGRSSSSTYNRGSSTSRSSGSSRYSGSSNYSRPSSSSSYSRPSSSSSSSGSYRSPSQSGVSSNTNSIGR